MSLKEHLSKFPDIFHKRCGYTHKEMEEWREEHEKLYKAKVSQISSLDSKTIRELAEVARQLVDSLVWGDRKDIGDKFPRTPLTKKEYSIASRAYAEKWVKLSDVKALLVSPSTPTSGDKKE